MRLFNTTAVPSLLQVNANPSAGSLGIGVVAAKATFRFDARAARERAAVALAAATAQLQGTAELTLRWRRACGR